ncbi:MAG TPA: hypothetical protein VGI64_04890 [Streptosporangiaceae bacterium]
MAATLQEILLSPDVQPKVVDDCHALIERELADKPGISMAAIRLAYKTVNAFAAGHVRHMLEVLLPRIVEELQPYWAEFSSSGAAEFGDYLAKRGGEVSQALLSVTDERAEGSHRPVIVKAYRSVRGFRGQAHPGGAAPGR